MDLLIVTLIGILSAKSTQWEGSKYGEIGHIFASWAWHIWYWDDVISHMMELHIANEGNFCGERRNRQLWKSIKKCTKIKPSCKYHYIFGKSTSISIDCKNMVRIPVVLRNLCTSSFPSPWTGQDAISSPDRVTLPPPDRTRWPCPSPPTQ